MKYEPRLHIVLHEPEIPQNTGNVGRTCVAIGAKLWLIHPLGFRLDQKSLRRAGLDYWEHLAWSDLPSWSDLEKQLPATRYWYFTKTAKRSYCDVEYRIGDALVFGSESSGLPESLLKCAEDQRLRIPTRSAVRSLNLSNAVAVAAYEAVRQCSAKADFRDLNMTQESEKRAHD